MKVICIVFSNRIIPACTVLIPCEQNTSLAHSLILLHNLLIYATKKVDLLYRQHLRLMIFALQFLVLYFKFTLKQDQNYV